MLHHLRLFGLLLCGPLTCLGADLPSATEWQAASNGAAPAHSLDMATTAGVVEYACRARIGGVLHVGRLPAGGPACSIGVAGREFRIATYEVLAMRLHKFAINKVVQAQATTVIPRATAFATIIPPVRPPALEVSDSLKLGFAADGRPYVEQKYSDGTVVRNYPNGVESISPQGNKSWRSAQYMSANAQPPTPPELPADPAKGRFWIEQHNEALLGVISTLVRGNKSELQKLADAERKNVSSDLFEQARNRTDVAAFFALHSSNK